MAAVGAGGIASAEGRAGAGVLPDLAAVPCTDHVPAAADLPVVGSLVVRRGHAGGGGTAVTAAGRR